MTTNRPPMTAPSDLGAGTMVTRRWRPPRASDPVSPMKIFAGEVFHHRKPTQAPMIAAQQHGSIQRIAGVVAVHHSPGVEVDIAHLAPLPER